MSAPIKLPPVGQALVICGPEGCGKSKLAVDLTGHQGPWPAKEVYFEDHWQRLVDAAFPRWPRHAPDFVIVEGFPSDGAGRIKLAALVSATEFKYEVLGRDPRVLRQMPRFIFTTTQDLRDFKSRRFITHLVTP